MIPFFLAAWLYLAAHATIGTALAPTPPESASAALDADLDDWTDPATEQLEDDE